MTETPSELPAPEQKPASPADVAPSSPVPATPPEKPAAPTTRPLLKPPVEKPAKSTETASSTQTHPPHPAGHRRRRHRHRSRRRKWQTQVAAWRRNRRSRVLPAWVGRLQAFTRRWVRRTLIGAASVVALVAIGFMLGRWDGQGLRQQLGQALHEKQKQLDDSLTHLDRQTREAADWKRQFGEVRQKVDKLQRDRDEAQRQVSRLDGVRGALRVNTQPAGATVRLGGEASAVTPAVFESVLAGKYPVTIQLDGYEPIELPVEVKAQLYTDLGTLRLVRSKGNLVLHTDPEGARFELVGRDRNRRQGVTPALLADLPAGPYRLKITQPSYPDLQTDIRVERNTNTPFRWAFGEGVLAVNTSPPGAAIRVNGTAMGQTPTQLRLPAGTYAVALQYSAWPEKTQNINVAKGETAALDWIFQVATLEIQSERPGTLIWTGNTFLGMAPLVIDLPSGPHELWALQPGRVAEKQALDLAPGERRVARFTLSTSLGLKVDKASAHADQYLDIYLLMQLADREMAAGQWRSAYDKFQQVAERLQLFQKAFPDYEVALVSSRLEHVRRQLAELEKKAAPKAFLKTP